MTGPVAILVGDYQRPSATSPHKSSHAPMLQAEEHFAHLGEICQIYRNNSKYIKKYQNISKYIYSKLFKYVQIISNNFNDSIMMHSVAPFGTLRPSGITARKRRGRDDDGWRCPAAPQLMHCCFSMFFHLDLDGSTSAFIYCIVHCFRMLL